MPSTCRRTFLQVWPALGALTALGACEQRSAADGVDADWHRRQLIDQHLAHWARVAPQPGGALRSQFTRDWQPKPGQAIELTGHARLIVALLAGAQAGGPPQWRELALAGGEFLLQHFRDPVHGGFFHAMSLEGAPLSDAKRSYGHAFALLALAELARASGEAQWQAAALQAWQDIARNLRDPLGGLIAETGRNFAPPKQALRTQNPVMHGFEALLALALLDGEAGAQARAGARRLGDFVLRRLLQGLPDGGAQIPEWYDAQWQPLPTGAAGGYIDLGHQFEWVHLLLRGAELGLNPVYAGVAERLLQFALQRGYDDSEGGCFNRLSPEGQIDRSKGWWQQAECLRALMAAASANPQQALWRRVRQTQELVQQTLIDPRQGGWFPGVQCQLKGCADEQPDPYHMAGLHMAALRLAG